MMRDNLINLLYDIKEYAIEQVPINLNSLVNSFSQIDYDVYFDKNVRVLMLKIRKDPTSEFICTIYTHVLDEYEVTINGCRWREVPELDYTIYEGRLLGPPKYLY